MTIATRFLVSYFVVNQLVAVPYMVDAYRGGQPAYKVLLIWFFLTLWGLPLAIGAVIRSGDHA